MCKKGGCVFLKKILPLHVSLFTIALLLFAGLNIIGLMLKKNKVNSEISSQKRYWVKSACEPDVLNS